MTFVPKNFFDGIYDLFFANSALKNAVTGLYPAEAPQGTAYPYIVYFMVDDIPARWFSHTSEVIRVQFSVFDDSYSMKTVVDVTNKLMACYDDATITVDNYTSVYVTRALSSLTRVPGASEQERVWHYYIDYMIRISE